MAYTTTLDKLCAYLDAALDGDAEVYRNQLPPGYNNTDAAVVVTMQSETHHQSKADRLVSFEIRVYAGTAVSLATAVLGEEVIDLINNGRSNAVNILRIGNVQGQELPPEIDTGWPSYRVTAQARITN